VVGYSLFTFGELIETVTDDLTEINLVIRVILVHKTTSFMNELSKNTFKIYNHEILLSFEI
jgi:hypothetical protein